MCNQVVPPEREIWLWDALLLESVDRMLAGNPIITQEEIILLSVEEEAFLQQEINAILSGDGDGEVVFSWEVPELEPFEVWDDGEMPEGMLIATPEGSDWGDDEISNLLSLDDYLKTN